MSLNQLLNQKNNASVSTSSGHGLRHGPPTQNVSAITKQAKVDAVIKPKDCIMCLLGGVMIGGALSACTMGDDASITSVPKYGTIQYYSFIKVVVDKDTCVEYFKSRGNSGTTEVLTLRVKQDGFPLLNKQCEEGK